MQILRIVLYFLAAVLAMVIAIEYHSYFAGVSALFLMFSGTGYFYNAVGRHWVRAYAENEPEEE